MIAHRLSILLLAGCAADPVPCPEPPPPETTAGTETPSETPPPPVADERVVVLDGTPEVPPELHARLLQYTNTRSASLQSVSADGGQLLIATRFAETSQLHRVEAPGGMRRQLTFLDEPIRDGQFVPRDPMSVVYASDVGGSENYQLYRYDLRTGRTALLTDGTSRTQSYVFTDDGALLAFGSNARNGRDLDIWLSDGRDAGSRRMLLERSGWWNALDFSPDGTKLLLQEYVSINDTRLFVVDVGSGEVVRITPEQPVAAHHYAAFGPTANEVFLTSDHAGEHSELYHARLDRPDEPWRPLTRDIPWSVEDLAVSSDGRTVAFATNEDGLSVLRLLDARSRRSRTVPEIPRGILSNLQFATGAPVLGFSVYTATRTGDAYTYDVRRRRLVRWTESEVGGLNPETMVEPTLVRFRSFDEREIPAFYYRPRGEGPFPVVIDIHGGPESQARPYFSPLVQLLAAESGIAVLQPNVRGSDGYGKSYLLLDNGEHREDSVRDIGALLDWIAAQPELDEGRVAVLGGSYGGYMVLASLVYYSDRLRAGVDIVGISSFLTFLENTAEYRRDLRRAEYGDERDPEMRLHLERISPLRNVERIRSALFVVHGANDPRVPAAEAEQIVRAVRQNGHDVWFMLARNEGHGFQKKENRDTYMELAVLFLERHLRGD